MSTNYLLFNHMQARTSQLTKCRNPNVHLGWRGEDGGNELIQFQLPGYYWLPPGYLAVGVIGKSCVSSLLDMHIVLI